MVAKLSSIVHPLLGWLPSIHLQYWESMIRMVLRLSSTVKPMVRMVDKLSYYI
jgi:hypothetical protein